MRILTDASGTDAVTRVLVESRDGEREWTTVGVDGNIVEASWLALCDALAHKALRAHPNRQSTAERSTGEQSTGDRTDGQGVDEGRVDGQDEPRVLTRPS